jgi:hypothetical protein
MSVRALSHRAVIVRIGVGHDRPTEVRKELTGIAGFEPYRQGTDTDLLWEFSSREWADMFAVSAKYVPGVMRVAVG